VSKNLVLIKNMLYGTADTEPQTDIVVAQLAQELYNSTLLLLFIQNLAKIDFEVIINDIKKGIFAANLQSV
jgi:calcium binding protein 39